MRPRVVEEDFPCWEGLPFDIPESVQDNYEDLFSNVSGLKLGGWPTLIQSEIFWAPWNQHPAAPEYVFQVDSEPKANSMVGLAILVEELPKAKKTIGRASGNVTKSAHN